MDRLESTLLSAMAASSRLYPRPTNACSASSPSLNDELCKKAVASSAASSPSLFLRSTTTLSATFLPTPLALDINLTSPAAILALTWPSFARSVIAAAALGPTPLTLNSFINKSLRVLVEKPYRSCTLHFLQRL